MKQRLDKYLSEIYQALSRNKIQEMIENNFVKVNNEICNKKNYLIDANDKVEVINHHMYVSRSANKLKFAIENFNLNLENKNCLDIGSSTGGFCQVMLENNVSLIYAIDVGSQQMHEDLRKLKKIKLYENTNFLEIENSIFDSPIEFVACDVSFISSKKIIKKLLQLFNYQFQMVLLIKPQYETKNLKINNLAKNKKYHQLVIDDFKKIFFENKIKFSNIVESPILGKEGFQEYLVHLEFNNEK